jgi:putrescine transport system permease protein
MSARRIFTRPARLAAIAPYLWMALFFLVPFGFVLKISLSQTAIAQPPYLPVFDLTQGFAAIKAALAELCWSSATPSPTAWRGCRSAGKAWR